MRLSLKLFNVTPEDLPVSVRQEVLGLVSADPVRAVEGSPTPILALRPQHFTHLASLLSTDQ